MVARDWMLAGMLSYSEKLGVLIIASVFPRWGHSDIFIHTMYVGSGNLLEFKILHFNNF